MVGILACVGVGHLVKDRMSAIIFTPLTIWC